MPYVDYLPVPQYGENPWTLYSQQSQSAVNKANNASSTLNEDSMQLQQQMQDYNQYADQSAYPTMPNDYGLGTQAGAPATGNYNTTSEKGDPGATSRGFNPWSLQGEALSR